MDRILFDWNEAKGRDNQQTHGVSFEEARSVFLDEDGLIRIISARKPTTMERRIYLERKQ